MTRAPRLAWLALLGAAGCGTNSAGVPAGLLAAIEKPAEIDGSAGASAYPAGPYGVREGDVTKDLCFDGWKDPKAESYDVDHLEHICLSDFHADASARLLLVESCAIWCVACRAEYGGDGAQQPSLAERLSQRHDEGFRVLGTIFQDAASKPATPADAATWARVYSLEFPFVDDPDHELGLFTSSVVAPFNLLVDTRTMKIVLELSGDEPSVLFGAVDHFLASGSSSR